MLLGAPGFRAAALMYSITYHHRKAPVVSTRSDRVGRFPRLDNPNKREVLSGPRRTYENDTTRRMLSRMPRRSTTPLPARAVDIRRRPSAKDVARLAGVSTATVSRALNSPDDVDAETRNRVETAIEQLRYVPHGAARALRSRRSRMIGAVVPSFDYALYARMTSALQTVLDERGYSLVLATHYYDLSTEVRVTEQLITHGVDAFAFVGLDHDARLYTLLNNYGRPYVLTWGVDRSGCILRSASTTARRPSP